MAVGRDDPIEDKGDGPIYVCTRNDDLEEVIARTPPSLRSDLVFTQNGMLEPFLNDYGLEENTQLLIYFAVSKKVRDGMGRSYGVRGIAFNLKRGEEEKEEEEEEEEEHYCLLLLPPIIDFRSLPLTR